MLRLAGEIGDGVIVNFVTPETVAPMLDNTRDGMRAAGKDPAGLDVVCRIICAVDEDESVARTLFRRSLTAYVTVPQYNKFFREIGFDKEATTAINAWNAGDRKKALETIPDEMVDEIFVFGTAEKCRRRLDDYAQRGNHDHGAAIFVVRQDAGRAPSEGIDGDRAARGRIKKRAPPGGDGARFGRT